MALKITTEQQRRITEATEGLAFAEGALSTALKALESGKRADKQMVSDAVRTAFDSLTVARAKLAGVLHDAGR